MANCSICGVNAGFLNDLCEHCSTKRENEKKEMQNDKPVTGNSNDDPSLNSGLEYSAAKEASKLEELKKLEQDLKNIMLTTESAPQLDIVERIEIISAECVFGMNIFKDLFAGVRDIVGGRSKSTQNILKDSRKLVLNELKKEACLLGANAVVAVDLNYSEFSGGGKSMLLVIATGTAVKVKL